MKQSFINNDSWHFKFNQWTYGSNYRPPTLCPYFWKTLLAFAIFPPVLIFKGLSQLDCWDIDPPNWDISYKTQEKIGEFIKYGLISLPILGLLYLIQTNEWVILTIIGAAVGGISLFVGIGYVLTKAVPYLHDKIYRYYRVKRPYVYKEPKHKPYRKPQPYKEKKPNFVIQFIKGWYHNNCPIIEYY